ncbi:MAG TPA: flagellar assembly protein FliH [Methylophilus sp.]|nr:flagellar assembly protein FliH [Methylophilus sp.]HQQ33747.1 flagellar assembly protein FliH [Methylophilus sp.]
MSNMSVPKEQQTAYQRWEMSAFSQPDTAVHSNSAKKKTPDASAAKISEVFESIRKEAYSKGMQEGFAVGLAKAKDYAEDDRQRFTTLANAFEEALKLNDEKIEENILALALDIAKAMLKTKLQVDREAILPVVKEAMHYLPYVQKPARIFVHHEDARILREQLGDELSEQVWLIQEDNNIERGGCVVETGANQIDATNATRWKRISEALAQSNDWMLP